MKKITIVIIILIYNIGFAQNDNIDKKEISFKQLFLGVEFSGGLELQNTVNYNSTNIDLEKWNSLNSIGIFAGYRTTFNSYLSLGFQSINLIRIAKFDGTTSIPVGLSIPVGFTYVVDDLRSALEFGLSGLSFGAGVTYNFNNTFHNDSKGNSRFQFNDDLTTSEIRNIRELSSLEDSNFGAFLKVGFTSYAFNIYIQINNDITNFIEEVDYKRTTLSAGMQIPILGSKIEN